MITYGFHPRYFSDNSFHIFMVGSVEADDAHFPLAPWGNAAVLGADALSAADARQAGAGVGGTRTLDDPGRHIDSAHCNEMQKRRSLPFLLLYF